MQPTASTVPDYRQLDDPALIAMRARVRAELEHPPASPPAREALTELAALLDAELTARTRPAA